MNDGKGLDYFIPEKEEIKDTDLPMSHRFGYIALVIGAALNTKKLPIHKLKDLCLQTDFPIILLGGKEDRSDGDEIASVNEIKVYNACGKFALNESADLVRNARLVITNDTGLMHIAAAFKKKMISVWGNTVPQFGMDAYYGNEIISHFKSEITNLSCRPCSKIGYNKCPKKHFKCMEQQDVEVIAVKAIEFEK